MDLGPLRIVHACWHEPSIRLVENALGSNRFNSLGQFVRAATEGDPLYDAIEVLLKGPEVSLADHGQPSYLDKDGNARDRARVAWWRADAKTLRDVAVMDPNFTTEDGQPYPALPEIDAGSSVRSYCYRGEVPVFYGHYWRRGIPKQGLDWNARTACVDFSAVKGGNLVAYRWNGETEIHERHFVSGQD